MDDKTMLEMAARAVGFAHFFYSETFGDVTVANDMTGPVFGWNPLTDDGDALRLAVRLRLECMYAAGDNGACTCQYWIGGEGFKQVTEEINGGPYAATRRAIVRAAAEIGKGMGVGE